MLKRLGNYTFEWKLSLFTILLFPLMLSLGFWQLDREQEKLVLQEVYTTRQAAQPVLISSLNWLGDLQYITVELSGKFDNEYYFLLDNKINAGRVGFEVIVPFYLETGELVLINRGWAPQGQYRTDFPVLDLIEGNVTVKGSIYMPLGEQVMLGDEGESSTWPRVIQSIEPNDLADSLGLSGADKVFPYSVRLLENAPGVLVRNWPVISTRPEKHRAYAVQWFAMALVLMGLYLYVSTKQDIKTELESKA